MRPQKSTVVPKKKKPATNRSYQLAQSTACNRLAAAIKERAYCHERLSFLNAEIPQLERTVQVLTDQIRPTGEIVIRGPIYPGTWPIDPNGTNINHELNSDPERTWKEPDYSAIGVIPRGQASNPVSPLYDPIDPLETE